MRELIRVRRDFVAQYDHSDCGIACLRMILNYTCRNNGPSAFQQKLAMPDKEGLSLLDLKRMAADAGLAARPVLMDTATLRTLTSPCVLHISERSGNNHFVVCYGAKKRRNGYVYLLADPATQVHYLPESELHAVWASNGVLYFDALRRGTAERAGASWIQVLRMCRIPGALWVSVALLNLLTLLSGIALTWVLQRGVNDPLSDKKQGLVYGVLSLLLVIGLFKGIFGHARQRLLIAISASVGDELVLKAVEDTLTSVQPYRRPFRSALDNARKIQAAVMVSVATLASDGGLVLMILCVMAWFRPVAAAICALYLLAIIGYGLLMLPGFSFAYARLAELSGAAERAMATDLGKPAVHDRELPDMIRSHQQKHQRYLHFSRDIAIRVSRMNLHYDCAGAVSVVTVFAVCLPGLKAMELAYSSFLAIVILSFFLTTVVPRLCNALIVFAEGADACWQRLQDH